MILPYNWTVFPVILVLTGSTWKILSTYYIFLLIFLVIRYYRIKDGKTVICITPQHFKVIEDVYRTCVFKNEIDL